MQLRKVNFDDWEILLAWRNDPVTRQNSHHTEPVTEENHRKWLTGILDNPDRQLFIAFEGETPVGTVRADFSDSDNSYELSWTISPGQRGKGIGKKIVSLLAKKLNARLRAEVKKGNDASVKIAEAAGLSFKKEEAGVLYFSNY